MGRKEDGMNEVSTEKLKEAILAVEAERLKQPAAFRPDADQRSTLDRGRAASEKMLAEFLTGAGLDLERFRGLQEQRGAELERMVAEHKAAALRQAAERQDTLYSSVAEQSKALRDLASGSDFFPNPSFSLDTPFLIWTIPLVEISDSAAVPFGSWAKWRFKTSDYEGTQKLGFYFYWSNPFSDYAVINAATFMSATGHLKAHAPWGFPVNSSYVLADALLNLWLGWPSGVTSSAYDRWRLGSVGAITVLGTPETNGTSISAGVNLSTTMFAVPPGTTVIFEVALALDYMNDSGDIDADFESGAFKVTCPVVVFSLLNSPP
jgi:hypothetical protein